MIQGHLNSYRLFFSYTSRNFVVGGKIASNFRNPKSYSKDFSKIRVKVIHSLYLPMGSKIQAKERADSIAVGGTNGN